MKKPNKIREARLNKNIPEKLASDLAKYYKNVYTRL